jgi:hypothetical protein
MCRSWRPPDAVLAACWTAAVFYKKLLLLWGLHLTSHLESVLHATPISLNLSSPISKVTSHINWIEESFLCDSALVSYYCRKKNSPNLKTKSNCMFVCNPAGWMLGRGSVGMTCFHVVLMGLLICLRQLAWWGMESGMGVEMASLLRRTTLTSQGHEWVAWNDWVLWASLFMSREQKQYHSYRTSFSSFYGSKQVTRLAQKPKVRIWK